MNLVILVIIMLVIIGIAGTFKTSTKKQRPQKHKAQYDYSTKEHIMTRSEESFFKLLNDVTGGKYYIFPQIHLSSILDHQIKGQNWKAAFSHINGKSVDYVLCDKITLKTVCAIELDDSTHNREDRTKRDQEVERIFNSSGVKLKRFTSEESRDTGFVIRSLQELS